QSQSGTGKTLAYILVALQVVDFSIEQTQVLVITPTIELSYQVHEKIKIIGKNLENLRIELAIKDKKRSIFVLCKLNMTDVLKSWLDVWELSFDGYKIQECSKWIAVGSYY
ncbi:hypothetical protein MXB_1659, partial [Myxobolus squamalis]